MKKWLIALTLVLVPTLALGWDEVPQPGEGGTGCSQANPRTIANLPSSPEYGTICFVTNGSATASDCTTTGSDKKGCWYNGSSWTPIGSITLSFMTITAPSGTGPVVADSPTDTLALTTSVGLTITATGSTDTINISCKYAKADGGVSGQGCASFGTEQFDDNGAGNIYHDYSHTLAASGWLNANWSYWGTNGIIFEGATANANQTWLTPVDPSADRTIYLPNASGTVAVSATSPVTLSAAGDIGLTAFSGDVSSSGTTLTIGADKVLESHLKAVDTAADEECLTYETTTGDFEWQSCTAGAATLSFTTIDASSGTDPVADSATDTLVITGTAPITVTGDSAADSITIAVDLSAYLTSATAATTYLKLDSSNDPVTGALDVGSFASPITTGNSFQVWSGGAATNIAGRFMNTTNTASVDVLQLVSGNRTTGTAGDIGVIRMASETDAADTFTDFARIRWQVVDPSNLSQDGQLDFQVAVDDTITTLFSISSGAAYQYIYTSNGTVMMMEGTTNDANELILDPGDPTADRTITFPNETGTVCTTGSVCSGYLGTATAATTYLKLDSSNDPMTGQLQIGTAGVGLAGVVLDVYGSNTTTPLRISSYGDSTAVDIAQFGVFSATPANGDAIDLKFRAYTSDGAAGWTDNMITRVRSVTVDTTNASEDSRIDLGTYVAGTFQNIVLIGATSASSGTGSVAVQSGNNLSVADGLMSVTRSAGSANPAFTATNSFDNTFNIVADFYSKPATKADGNSTVIRLLNLDDAGTSIAGAYLDADYKDVTAGTIDVELRFVTMTNSVQIELFSTGATAAGLNFIEFNDSSLDADAIFDADSLDGAFCFDGTGTGAVHIGVNSTTQATCAETTRTHGSITGPDLGIERNGDAVLYIEADRDNVTETDNPCLVLGQDGGVIEGMLCLEGDAGDHYTNSTLNGMYIEAGTNGTAISFEIATNNRRRLGISNGGDWAIETNGTGIGVTAEAGDNLECQWIPASAFLQDSALGATCTQLSTTMAGSWGTAATNKLVACEMLYTTSNSTIYAPWMVPLNLSGSTASAYVSYEVTCTSGATCTAGSTNADNDDICWGFDTGPFQDLTAPSSLTATSVWAQDDVGTSSATEVIFLKSDALTITHGWVAGELAVIEITRDQSGINCGAAADDDFAANAYVVGVTVCYDVDNVFSGE